MSSLVKNIIKYSLTLALAVALVFYVLSTVNVAEMINKVKQAKLSWVILGVSINLLSHLSRARRWNLLMEPMGYKPKTHRTFVAVMVGYFANLFLPRMGEISRCAVLKRTDNVPIDKAFGTVVAERAFDFICLITLIGLSLILEFNRLTTFFSENVFNKTTPTAEASLISNPFIWGSAILGLFAIIYLAFREKIKKLIIYQKILAFIKGVLEGVFSIRNLKRKK
ncbi:MAG: flippase-like domain-containing protein [Sporocytophaga sp.]|nr:flippase-like domain-containing protein [Sporocytophaga sp.]